MRRAAGVLLTLCALVLGGTLLRGGPPAPIANLSPRSSSGASPSAAPATAASTNGSTTSALPDPSVAGDPYAALARQLQAHGVDVWFEIDLVARWLEGPQAFQEGLDRIRTLAALPGVSGFKVADELGYNDGINSSGAATDFLRAVRSGLARSGVHTKLLIDVVVPELGCLAWTPDGSQSCAAEARSKHPGVTEAAVTGYLSEGLVDDLDLSTSLLDEWTYQSWGVSEGAAQAAAWRHVNRLGWAGFTQLQSRKALAQPGGYQSSPQEADHDALTYVDVPVAGGAQAVDIWTWRQEYDGRTVSLLADDLASNPLWSRLKARHRDGVRLFTHITPSMMLPTEAQRSREYTLFAEVFDAAFVAAGVG